MAKKTGSDEHLFFEAKGIKFKVCGTEKIDGYWFTLVKNLITKEYKWVDSAIIPK